MKKLTMLFSILCLTLALTVPASALDYNIDGPGDPEYGKSTSIEPVVTADRGELPNVDVSKNAALIPPTFGSPTAYTLNTGNPLTPNLAPGYMLGEGPSSTATPGSPLPRLTSAASPAAARPAETRRPPPPPLATRRARPTSTTRAATWLP